MIRLGVLISGGGTNLQAIIDHINNGNIRGKIELIISNKRDAYGLVRGKEAGIESKYINPKDFEDEEQYNGRLMKEFKDRNVDMVVLAGYLKILSGEFVREFKNRIINIHPSLIPSFCGDGYYGEKVHRAVIDYGCKLTGATVHIVDEGTDTGPIILQKSVEVEDDETVPSLQGKVLKMEHRLLVEAIKLYCDNRISVEGRRVKII